MADFPTEVIEVRSTTDNWGPFNFDMTNRIPSGDAIASFTVDAYVGTVQPTDTLSDFTEMGASLIETSPAKSNNDTTLSIYLKYPSDTYKGENITLVFNVTFTLQTGIHPFYFHHVKIQ